MLELKSILFFSGKCILIYLLLLVADSYLGVGEKQVIILRNVANVLYQQVGETGAARFQRSNSKPFDTKIGVTNAKIKERGWFEAPTCIWDLAYLPTILLISLILASSFTSITRKILALIAGFALINAFVLCVLRFRVSFLFNEAERGLGKFDPSFSSQIIDFIDQKLIFWNMGFLMIVPIFIWLLVSFRKSEYEQFVKGISKA